MLHILGMILKITGILLGSILGMILLLSLLILFVSIRYRVNGSYGQKDTKDLDVKARISWLFSIVIVDIAYDGRETSQKIRIFGIPLGRKKSAASTRPENIPEKTQNTEKEENAETNQSTKKEQAYITEKEHKTEKEQNSQNEKLIEKEQHTEEIQQREHTQKSHQEQEPEAEQKEKRRRFSLTEKLRQLREKIKAAKKTIHDKIVNIKEKITQVHAILTDEKNKEALRLIGRQLRYLWKHIKPKKLSVICRFGFDDPALTGQALAAASVLYPYYRNRIQLYPNFEQKIFSGEAYVKGRIRIFPMVLIIIRLWKNKQIRSMVKKWMKKNS